MKRISVLIALLALLAACNKTDNNDASASGNFTITGVRDVDLSVTSTGSYTFPISIASSTGQKDTVSLAGDLVPAGLYASFRPVSGTTPFTSQVTISTDYLIAGGTYGFKIKGTDKIGSRAYDIKATVGGFRGWQLGSDNFDKESLEKDAGTLNSYASIKVTAPNGAHLNLSFAKGAGLPKANSSYKISSDTGKSSIQIALYEGSHIWSATGNRTDGIDAPTGIFTFDTLRRFTFKCVNVEMTDGLKKLPLNCSFSE